MKALILNGSDGKAVLNNVSKVLALELKNKGLNVERYDLSTEKISTCIGCYGCWLKTPGQCIINDKGQEIAEKVIKSDLLILLSPVTFGGYSFHLKKVIDRLIPNILPFFTKIDGEIHHKPRYKKNPKILAIGYVPQQDKESERVFAALISRNAINMHSPKNHVEFINDEEGDINTVKVNLMLEKVGMIS